MQSGPLQPPLQPLLQPPASWTVGMGSVLLLPPPSPSAGSGPLQPPLQPTVILPPPSPSAGSGPSLLAEPSTSGPPACLVRDTGGTTAPRPPPPAAAGAMDTGASPPAAAGAMDAPTALTPRAPSARPGSGSRPAARATSALFSVARRASRSMVGRRWSGARSLGVLPFLSARSSCAPDMSRAATTSSVPCMHAKCRGEEPSSRSGCTGAPDASRARTTSGVKTERCRGEKPLLSGSCCAPAESREKKTSLR